MHILGRLFAGDPEVVVALHALEPADDVGVGLRLQVVHLATHLQCLRWQHRLHFAQRHRQQGRQARLGKTLDDAERRGRELGQRRHGGGGHGEREAVGIGQCAAGVVAQVFGQFQREFRLFIEQRLETHAADQRRAGLVAVERGFVGLLVGLEADGLGLLAWDGRGEAQGHRADRQTGGLRVFTLAAEAGGEGLAHLEIEAFLNLVGQAAGGGHALAIDQLHARGGRQAQRATECDEALRLLGGGFGQAQIFQQGLAGFAVHQLDRQAFAHALGGAPQVGLQALGGGGAVELQHEELLFVDRAIAWPDLADKRPAGVELEALRALELLARHGSQRLVELRGATHAGRQVARELKHPLAFAVPAARAFGRVGVGTAQGEGVGRLGVAKADGSFVKLDDHLAHLRHFFLGGETADLEGRSRIAEACPCQQQRTAGEKTTA